MLSLRDLLPQLPPPPWRRGPAQGAYGPASPPAPENAAAKAAPEAAIPPAQPELPAGPARAGQEGFANLDDYVIVMQRKGHGPPLGPRHQRFAEASRIAGEATRHLAGVERVRAKGKMMSRLLKGE